MSQSRRVPIVGAIAAALVIAVVALPARPAEPSADTKAPGVTLAQGEQPDVLTPLPTGRSTPARSALPAKSTTEPSAANSGNAIDAALKAARPGTFEIHFHESGLREAFQLLSSQGHKNIIMTKEVVGKVSADLYGVTFKEALEAVLRSTGYVYEEDGNFIYVMTADQRNKQIEAQRKFGVMTVRLSYVTANDARTLITPALSKDGTIAVTPAAGMGIVSSKVEAGGNSYATDDVLVIRDYEDNLAKIRQLVKDIDVRPEQVLIEATILRVTLDESNALGVDFSILSGVDFSTLQDTTTDITSVNAPTSPVDITSSTQNVGTFRTDFNDSVPEGGATFGIITDKVSFFIRAIENVTDTTVLANPKLLVINKQRGEVMVGNRDGYLTTTVAENIATQSVQFLETGTRLIVRPYVGKNGYVRMELHPEDSSGSVSTVGTSALPKETTTEVTSNVLVRDGHTIVIGGLFRERTVAGRSQVPGIGNIPVVGTAFRSTNDSTVREEVIILITPHIIKQEVDEAVGEQMKDDVERYRAGARKGLQWWGRSRLAQSEMRLAKQCIAEGKIDKALFHLDMALSMDTHMIDAIRLKERLTDKAYWSDEAKNSSVEYVIEKMLMTEIGVPVDRVIPPDKPLYAKDIHPEKAREVLDIQPEYLDPIPVGYLGESKATTQPAKVTQIKSAPKVADSKKDVTVEAKPAVNSGKK